MKYMSPKEFMKNAVEYPKYTESWKEFKAELGNEMFGALADKFKKEIKNHGNQDGPYILGTYAALAGDLYSNFFRFDYLYKKGILNTCMPSSYSGGDAFAVAEKIEKSRKFLKNSDTLPWLSAGYNANSECEPIEFRYCLLESFIRGSRGFTLFTWRGCDAMDLRELSIAMSMVVPVEDIIMEGKTIKKLKVSKRRAKITGLEKGTEKLILISDYYGSEDTKISFDITVDTPCRAINMFDKSVISTLKKGNNKIETIIPKSDRAQLIYIGKRSIK
jgi:hypothetical protein